MEGKLLSSPFLLFYYYIVYRYNGAVGCCVFFLKIFFLIKSSLCQFNFE